MILLVRPDARCLSTRQYARLLSDWIASIGLDPALFGTHSLRRTKATYRRTGNLRAVQLLLGHTKVESAVRYLGIESITRAPLPSRLTSEGAERSRSARL
jgi:integrase